MKEKKQTEICPKCGQPIEIKIGTGFGGKETKKCGCKDPFASGTKVGFGKS